MPRSFLVKKSLKSEESGYHSYRVRDPYDDILDVSLKAATAYTPYLPYTPRTLAPYSAVYSPKAVCPYTPSSSPSLPAAVAPITARVNNGYIHDVAPAPAAQQERDAGRSEQQAGARTPQHSSAADNEAPLNLVRSEAAEEHAVVERREAGRGERGGAEIAEREEEEEVVVGQEKEEQEMEEEEAAAEEEREGRDAGASEGPQHVFTNGVTVGYTYEAFFISDGRSKRRCSLDSTGSGLDEAASVHSLSSSSNSNHDSNSSSSSEARAAGKDSGAHAGAEASSPSSSSSSPLLGSRQRYTCSECGKDYATSSNLSRHKQTHRSLDSSSAKKCPHCDKVYVSMPALSMHVLTHDLKHTCTVCGKHFSRPWLLQGHMRSHTGEKPYGCAHCGKAFADRSNLRAHMQTHSAFKTFACGRCHKSFALKSYLNKHYESACIKE